MKRLLADKKAVVSISDSSRPIGMRELMTISVGRCSVSLTGMMIRLA
ncbi:MAG: hypothetical protein KQH59_01830 [Desulfobulbaceae bacterium]|nr:hypothetical protein [Desulfobulbaceae bacterium]